MNFVLRGTPWRGRLGYYTEPALAVRQPDPPLEFPGEQGMFIDMCAQVREEEQVMSPQFTRNQQDVSMRRRKKRKQVEEGAFFAPCLDFVGTCGPLHVFAKLDV